MQKLFPALDQMPAVTPPECESHEYESLSVGCTNSQEHMEFKTPCTDHSLVGNKTLPMHSKP